MVQTMCLASFGPILITVKFQQPKTPQVTCFGLAFCLPPPKKPSLPSCHLIVCPNDVKKVVGFTVVYLVIRNQIEVKNLS